MENNELALTKKEINDLMRVRISIDDKIAIKQARLEYLEEKERETTIDKYAIPGTTHFIFSKDPANKIPLITAITIYEICEDGSISCLLVRYDVDSMDGYTCKSTYYSECSRIYFSMLFNSDDHDVITATKESAVDDMLLRMIRTTITPETYKDYKALLQ